MTIQTPGPATSLLRVASTRANPLVRLLRTFVNDLACTIFPADCAICTGPLLQASALPVCTLCLDSLARQARTLCSRCGEALGASLDPEDLRFAGMLPEGLLCTPCRAVPPAFTCAVAFGEYRDELRKLIHLLKYERVPAVARQLAPLLAQAIQTLPLALNCLVIAVPLFPAKERQRGYNQSVLLANAAIRKLKLTPAHKLLQRIRATEDQFTLNPAARRRNLRGAFRVTDPSPLVNREVLLVDDIFTSGATARECARVLVKAGAARVWVATLARAQANYIDQPHPNEFAADTTPWTLTKPPEDVAHAPAIQ